MPREDAIIRLENTAGGSSKFWEVEIHGSAYRIRYGRIGAKGTVQEKSFGSPEEATEAAEKKAASKRKKGYVDVEVAPTAEIAPPPPKEEKPPSHRDAVKAAFAVIRKAGIPALANRGHAQSAGWEDLGEACRKKKLDPVQGIFWHKQSDEAFGNDGRLIHTLWLHWAGDLDVFVKALEEQGLDLEVPTDPERAIGVKPTPLPGMKILPTGPIDEAYPAEVAAIDADPQALAPYQALLKAMQAKDDERARFVELQLEFEKKGKLSKKKAKEVEAAVAQFGVAFARGLAKQFEHGSGVDMSRTWPTYTTRDYSPKYRRGFPYSVSTGMAEHGAPRPDFSDPAWSTITELALEQAEALPDLCASAVAGRLEALKLTRGDLSPDDAPRFARLRAAALPTSSVDAVARLPALQELRFLDRRVDHESILARIPASLHVVRFDGLRYTRDGDGWVLRTGYWFGKEYEIESLDEVIRHVPKDLRRVEIGYAYYRTTKESLAALRAAFAAHSPGVPVVEQLAEAVRRLRASDSPVAEAEAMLRDGFTAKEVGGAAMVVRKDDGRWQQMRTVSDKLHLRDLAESYD